MRVPLSWLHEYVDFDLSTERLVDLFSLRSQEVDGVARMGVVSGEVVVGEVVEFGPHPNADKLSVAKVDLGGQEVQIVAGAPNPYPGARVPVILPGSVLADGVKLKKAKLRGLESYGMMMSERELGISPDHEGILLLGDGYEVGEPVGSYFPVGETVLDLEITPNRPDMMGMIGVARDLAAVLQTSLRIPEIPELMDGGSSTGEYGLRIEAEDLCPRYDLRRVSGLLPGGGRAPLWMRQRLYASGMRPIGGIVDATNYVMLETGQPIHAFDARSVREGIVVRRADPDEKLTMLDGSSRTFTLETLLIADEERALAVAGVMGGEDAEVSGETTDVLVEVANFTGRSILETSQRLGLRTDASSRFERNLDPNLVDYAMNRVTALLAEHSGGRVAQDTLSHYPEPAVSWEVPLRQSRIELLLGMPVGEDEAAARLEVLGCEVRDEDGRLVAEIPTFRRDLRREADLIEEVGRLVGLDRVPEALPGVALPGGLSPEQRRMRLLRRLLADLGMSEAVTYPFGPDRWTKNLGLPVDGANAPVRMRNPLSAEGGNLRTLILPGLLDAAARNRSFGVRGGALFEVGRIFESDPPPEELREAAIHFRATGRVSVDGGDGADSPDQLLGVHQPVKVGGLLAGTVRVASWNEPEVRAGFFEAKGIVERLVPGAVFSPGQRPYLHPGRTAVVKVGDAEAGWVGEVHPEVAGRFGLEGWPVAAFELEASLCDPDPAGRFRGFVNVPAVSIDLAVVVDREVRAGDLLQAISDIKSSLLSGTRVFDVYEGSQVPEGRKSVAINFTFQGEETLTDADVKAEVDRITSRLGDDFGAQVRAT